MKLLSIAVVASGFSAQQHVEAIRRLPGLHVVALCDPNLENLKEKASALGIERIFSDYREMLDTVQVDVLHNCTPNAYHYSINKYAMERGVHVYCEKPLAVTFEQGANLEALSKKTNLAAGVSFNYRGAAMVQEMRQRIACGDAGRMFLIRAQYLQDWLLYDTDYSWRLDEEEGGPSRAVADIGSHCLDTIQCIAGQRITAVCANLFTAHAVRKKPIDARETFSKLEGVTHDVRVSTEDGGGILFRLEDGLTGVLTVSQVSAGHKNDLRIGVDCANYSMEWQQENADRLILGTRTGGTETLYASPGALSPQAARYAQLPAGHAMGWSDMLKNSIREFYTALRCESYRQGSQTYATFSDGVYIMKLVDACLQSNRTGKWIEL